MKTILAYGDSLTWGTNAVSGGRHPHADQWPTVLEAGLTGARVVNAGLGGRTTIFDDFGAAADRNGARMLPTILSTFEPLDLVIIMLGTNDAKIITSGTAIGTAQGVKRLVEIIKTHPYDGGRAAPAVLIVAPPAVEAFAPNATHPLLSPRVPEAMNLAGPYADVARVTGSGFFDAGPVATAKGGGDGIHLDAENTRAIGRALVPVVAKMLNLKVSA